MKPKLTPWFPPDIKPMYQGSYLVTHPDWHGTKQEVKWAYWNGKQWSDSIDYEFCLSYDHYSFDVGGIYQDKQWRGIEQWNVSIAA